MPMDIIGTALQAMTHGAPGAATAGPGDDEVPAAALEPAELEPAALPLGAEPAPAPRFVRNGEATADVQAK